MTIQHVNNKQDRFGFALVVLYLFFEYGRPQGIVPLLNYLRPGIVLIGLLGFYLVATHNVRFETPQSKCMLGFLLLSAIHIPIAVNNYWAFQGAKAFLIYLIVFLSVTAFINEYGQLSRFINLWIGINVICALIGLNNGGKVPSSAFMGDENDFALVMNMAIPFAYFMFLETDSRKKKIIYLSACGLFIAAGVATLSRGGFVGLVPIILYCWYKTPKKIMASVTIGIMAAVLYFAAPDTYWDEVKSIQDESIHTGTGEGRWYAWKIAWQVFLENPVIGVGTENFIWNSGLYQPEDDLQSRASIAGRAAHSIYFTLIPDLGLAGIYLFATILYHSYKYNKQIFRNKALHLHQNKKTKYVIFGINGALLGYLISGAFISVFYYPHLWLLISVLTSAIKITKNSHEIN